VSTPGPELDTAVSSRLRTVIVLPEIDVLLRAFSRQDPDPAAVATADKLIEDRRLYMIGWVRQGLLTRVKDERQFQRLLSALAPFPDIPITPADHVMAASHTREMSERGINLLPAQALMWAMAERCGGLIWSQQTRWRRLERHGAPLYRS
jgi:hypothetical protein